MLSVQPQHAAVVAQCAYSQGCVPLLGQVRVGHRRGIGQDPQRGAAGQGVGGIGVTVLAHREAADGVAIALQGHRGARTGQAPGGVGIGVVALRRLGGGGRCRGALGGHARHPRQGVAAALGSDDDDVAARLSQGLPVLVAEPVGVDHGDGRALAAGVHGL